MAATHGQTDKATIGPRRQISITYPLPRETLLTAPIALPLTEPGSPQISFTVTAADMPALLGLAADKARYSPLLYVGGHNPTGILQRIYATMYINGVAWATEILEPDPTYQAWMNTYYPFGVGDPSIIVGDTLAIALWGDDTAVDYQYSALALFATQLRAATPHSIALNVALTGIVQFPQLTTPAIHVSSGNFTTATSVGFGKGTDTAGAPGIVVDPDVPLYLADLGDDQVGSGTLSLSDTDFFFFANYLPTVISYYPTSIVVPL